jgi:hypothetical protein
MLSNYISLIVFNYHLDAILFLIVRVGLDGSMALNNAVLDVRIVSDIHVIQDDRVLDVAVISNESTLEDN